METFINAHTITGFILMFLGVVAALSPKENRSVVQSVLVKLFFIVVLVMAVSGIGIGIYRHPTSISIFQIVTLLGIIFATLGLLAEQGKLEDFRKHPNLYWYINGLGGSLIATSSASLFFLALTFAKDFYQTNIVWLAFIFITMPTYIGREFIKRNLKIRGE
jgi:hypothetical protein